jgi:hypothetical protein
VTRENGRTNRLRRADLVRRPGLHRPLRFRRHADDGGKGTSLFTACEGKKGWAAVYIAVPRQKGGFYVVSLVGKPDKADEVKTVSAAFRSAAGQVAGY